MTKVQFYTEMLEKMIANGSKPEAIKACESLIKRLKAQRA